MNTRRQLGIRAKLFFAFAAVSGTTVIAGVAAWLMFSQVRDLFHGVAGRNIPEIVGTLGLQTETQALAGSAPTLLAVKNVAQQQQEITELKARQDVIARRLDAIAATRSDQESIAKLKTLIASMNTKLGALEAAVGDRLKLSARGEEIVKAAQAAQARLNDVLLPAGEKAQADITMVSMTIGGDANQSMMTLLKLVSTQVPVSQGFADLVGFVNLASSLMDRAAVAPDVASVAALEKNYKAMSARVEEKLDIVDTLQPTEGLRKAAEIWLKFGSGDTIFDARRKEIAASQLGQKLLDETRGLTDELAREVAGQVKVVTNKTKEATDRSDEAIGFGTFVMLMIAAVSVAGAALFVWFYIGRNLVARLVGLEKTMTRLASGDLSAEIGAKQGGDEIGQMAEALSVFREGIVQANAAAAEKSREQEAKQKQAAAVDQFTREFNDGATNALAAVSTAASRMKGSAEKMAHVAAQAKEQTSAVASASAQAAENVQTVAAATEELSSSVAEISRQVAEILAHRRAGGGAGGAQRSHRDRACQRGQPDRRSRRPDQHHCVADQFAGAERDHRSGAGGRGRQRLCDRGLRGQEPGDPDRAGHRRHHRAGHGDSGIDPGSGRYHQGDRRDHRQDGRNCHDRRIRGRRARRGDGGDRTQHSAGRDRDAECLRQHRRRLDGGQSERRDRVRRAEIVRRPGRGVAGAQQRSRSLPGPYQGGIARPLPQASSRNPRGPDRRSNSDPTDPGWTSLLTGIPRKISRTESIGTAAETLSVRP